MIVEKNGRFISERTKKEEIDLTKKMLSNLSKSETILLKKMLKDFNEGDYQVYQALSEYRYKHTPVSMEEFLDDPYYLGETTKTLYPRLRKDLIDLFSGTPYREAIFSGSIGWGKTTGATIIVCRMLYELSCLRSPQLAFGLAPGSEMTIALISKNKGLARKVLLRGVKARLMLSPYFKEQFEFKSLKWEIRFPHNIMIATAGVFSDQVLGLNVFGAVMDEVNFMGSKMDSIAGKKLDLATSVYTKLVRRIKSRYMTAGGDLPGMLAIVSSAGYKGSFTDTRREEEKESPDVFFRDYAIWNMKPSSTYSGERFHVLVGSGKINSRIVSKEEAEDFSKKWLEEFDCKLIEVPIEYWEDFNGKDIEGAIRDLAGLSVVASSSFIQRREAIEKNIDHSMEHPFSVEVYQFGQEAGFSWKKLTKSRIKRLKGGYEELIRKPLRSPSAPRWIHVDPALTGDSLGIAMGYISKYIEVIKRDDYNVEYKDIEPIFVIEFMLRVLPPKDERIELADIRRRLVYPLMGGGFKIAGFSSDSYQSAESFEHMKNKGVKKAIEISVDKTTEPYDILKSAMYEGRIRYYQYEPFIEELENLILDRKKNKVDHPPKGSKDVADAVAGLLFGLKKHAGKHRGFSRGSYYSKDEKNIKSKFKRSISQGLIRHKPGRKYNIKSKNSKFRPPFLMG